MSTLIKYTHGYTIADNRLLCGTNLSLKAKALYIYLDSKPNRWNFSVVGIASEMKESKNTVNAILTELEELQLLKRRQLKDGSDFGRMVYCLYNVIDSLVVTTRGRIPKERNSKDIEERKEVFRQQCGVAYKKLNGKMSPTLAKKFFDYWTEKTLGGKKMRFELQTVFEHKKRMETFITNDKSFNGNKTKKELTTKNT